MPVRYYYRDYNKQLLRFAATSLHMRTCQNIFVFVLLSSYARIMIRIRYDATPCAKELRILGELDFTNMCLVPVIIQGYKHCKKLISIRIIYRRKRTLEKQSLSSGAVELENSSWFRNIVLYFCSKFSCAIIQQTISQLVQFKMILSEEKTTAHKPLWFRSHLLASGVFSVPQLNGNI